MQDPLQIPNPLKNSCPGATLAQNDVSQAASSNRFLGRHILQKNAELVQTNVNNSTGIRERKDTVLWCPDCKVPPCMPECFKL